MVLTENIHKAWKEREIYSVVFMDVAGAFNNVHHDRLIHNMRKRRIPAHITRWIYSFLKNRSTKLRFNDTTSASIPTPAGTAQGSPLSGTLYLFYNGDLLDIPKEEGLSLGFIDDIAYGVQGLTDDGNVEKLEDWMKKAEDWKERHGAQFELTKNLLVHFTRNRNWKTDAKITINGITISPSQAAKYLGVIFDQQLRFKSHVEYLTKKGAKFALAMSSIAKSNWGTPFQYVRQLFTAVVAPRLDYAASIWHRPGQGVGQISKISTVQRLAMKTITGCFRTTPTSALEFETALLPPHLRLEGKILPYLARIQTLPSNHPVQAWIKKAIQTRNARPISSHISNLEHLAKRYPEYAAQAMETIRPYPRPPWWTPTITIHIDPTKELAKKHHDETMPMHNPNTTLCIYTDGSGINNHIGAAAYCPTIATTKHQYLGKESMHNVYAAELSAIHLATDIVKENSHYTKCVIYSDSQAALTATTKPDQQSGQSIICSILDNVESLQQQRPELTFSIVWIPGHEDIPGNEEVDAEAKRAAQPGCTLGDPFTHPPMKSARNATTQARIKMQWTKEWQEGKEDSKQLRGISKRPMVESGSKLYARIPTRTQLAWLARLRTGHCSLNHYLHRFGKIESPQCPCGEGIETVAHYLLVCNIRSMRQRERLCVRRLEYKA